MSGDQRSYFDALYGASEDPYALRTRWYEERKRALLLATLPQRRYRRAYEPGCGTGELTLALSKRCEEILASDGSERAIRIARERCHGLHNVRVAQQELPYAWPHDAGHFDLIVLSELGYFLDEPSMRRVANCCDLSLDADGTLIACDWRPKFRERALSTAEVHAALDAIGIPCTIRHEEEDFLLQVWSRDGRSVAEREGIR
ncbi:class I SAM-dependent methyltransferase [Variovorax sp. M-6]|uniref:class I SAM-dependent DNA methyltransferase n=1 Tax=Variovorax sp. M-6 TaxID=3233041 RepID=UPI003F9DA995